MLIPNVRQSVEIFHLLFLDQLGRKLDKALYALKGGCNLRFFFNSIRYSEDIDFDVKIVAKQTLRNKINLILNGTPFQQILRTKKFELEHISESKQTETTQRWKISFKTGFSQLSLNTKIEFSRRSLSGEVQFDPIHPYLIQTYSLMPIMTNHYGAKSAIEQKISALALRTETQARDIFDLYHLFNIASLSVQNRSLEQIELAMNNALNIQFDDFKGQVVAFLSEEYQKQYSSETVWNNMRDSVLQALEKQHEAH